MSEEIKVLKLQLHNTLVGYLVGHQNGRNALSFATSFTSNPQRPTLSLTTHPSFPRASQLMAEPWARSQRIHPVLSNLLPEGSLRELIAQGLKVHIDHEFHILSYLGSDLPGALVVEPMAPDDVPSNILSNHGNVKVVTFENARRENKFSLAGVQMKFSMQEQDGRYNLSKGDALGDWIIKTPSTQHADVPLNEFTAMTLASLVGVGIPEIKLVEMNKLDNLPQIKLPDEPLAFAIRRFDRDVNKRIHMEDFAQVLAKYPHEKYNSANYEQLGKILYEYSGDGIADTQQFARRLLVNVLLANGDAHLKNWSLLYENKVTPRLSPAYDIVTTRVYMENETQIALNLGKEKSWDQLSFNHFAYWAERVGIPWRMIKPHLDDVLERARDVWPEALRGLPMNEIQKTELKMHWAGLHEDFMIGESNVIKKQKGRAK